MPDLVFIVEEPSKEAFLTALLPRFNIPDTLNVYYQSGTGYSEFGGLVRQVLRSWRTPGTRFVILCDQDQNDCVAKKQELLAAVPEHVRRCVAVRIVCDELESWYVGERAALEQGCLNSVRSRRFPSCAGRLTQSHARLSGLRNGSDEQSSRKSRSQRTSVRG